MKRNHRTTKSQDLHTKHKQDRNIAWDRAKLERFKAAYKTAALGTSVPSSRLMSIGRLSAESNIVFTFEGHEFVLEYAKYLIEYLESKLK